MRISICMSISLYEKWYQRLTWHSIRRHNMPYGPEVTDEELDGRGTIYGRGLHVVCYQSSILRGFKFIQEGKSFCLSYFSSLTIVPPSGWFNNPDFPPNKPVRPGFDPIFGQTGKEDQSVHRYMAGTNPYSERELMTFPQRFIVPRGGEYFFVPSISTLRNHIAV